VPPKALAVALQGVTLKRDDCFKYERNPEASGDIIDKLYLVFVQGKRTYLKKTKVGNRQLAVRAEFYLSVRQISLG